MVKKNTPHITQLPVEKVINNGSTIEYVLPLGGDGWMVKNSRSKTFTVITDNKREAVSIARGIAKTKQIQLEIYGRDGNIEKTESYAS